MSATAYTGSSLTSTRFQHVYDTNGLSTIAVDPSIIHLGSLVYTWIGEAIAADTGSAIKDNIIDLYLNSYEDCIDWSEKTVKLYLIAYPNQW